MKDDEVMKINKKDCARKAKIKIDPIVHERFEQKNRQRYAKEKAEGKILT